MITDVGAAASLLILRSLLCDAVRLSLPMPENSLRAAVWFADERGTSRRIPALHRGAAEAAFRARRGRQHQCGQASGLLPQERAGGQGLDQHSAFGHADGAGSGEETRPADAEGRAVL